MNRAQRRAAARHQKPAAPVQQRPVPLIPEVQRHVATRDEMVKEIIRQKVDQYAHDATVEVEVSDQVNRCAWLMICSMADAFHIGPKRMQLFSKALTENSLWLQAKIEEDGPVAAYEKLRRRAVQVSGDDVPELFPGLPELDGKR